MSVSRLDNSEYLKYLPSLRIASSAANWAFKAASAWEVRCLDRCSEDLSESHLAPVVDWSCCLQTACARECSFSCLWCSDFWLGQHTRGVSIQTTLGYFLEVWDLSWTWIFQIDKGTDMLDVNSPILDFMDDERPTSRSHKALLCFLLQQNTKYSIHSAPTRLSCTTLASWWSELYQTTTELVRRHLNHREINESTNWTHMGSRWLKMMLVCWR